MTKEFILPEIKRTSETNGGKLLGIQKFYSETGIKHGDWFGKYWSRWNDAIKEIGLEPNSLVQPISSQLLLSKLAELVTELKRFPANSDLRLNATNNEEFPSAPVFERFGNQGNAIKSI